MRSGKEWSKHDSLSTRTKSKEGQMRMEEVKVGSRGPKKALDSKRMTSFAEM